MKSTVLWFIICLQGPLSYKPHLKYSDKRLAARAAGFPVASDSCKRLAVSAVEFPMLLTNLEAKLDGYS